MKATNLFTPMDRRQNAAGCAALMGSSSLNEHLPSASSIYTAELRAIVLGFKLIFKSPKEHNLHRLAIMLSGY